MERDPRRPARGTGARLRQALFVLLVLAPSLARGDGAKLGEVVVTGFVDLSAAYNPNRPVNHASFTDGTGTTGKRANELTVNLAALTFTLPPAPVGLTLGLQVGTGADVLYSGEVTAPGTSPSLWRFVREASVSWKPLPKLLLQAGIYPSHLGLESAVSRDDWTYTRSWSGEFSPYYQAGVKAAFQFNDEWSAQAHVCNGWNIVGDVNDGKSVGTQVAYTRGKLSVSLNTLLGPERAQDNRDLRGILDLVVQAPLGDRFSLQASADLAGEQQPDGPSKTWRAAQLSLRALLAGSTALIVRGEVFDDPDGGISGAGQTLAEATATLELHPADALLVKVEGRYDRSTARVFTRFDGKTDTQLLLALGAVASF